MTELLNVKNLLVEFTVGNPGVLGFGNTQKKLKAVNGVNLRLKAGETLGIVGESGCGKSTLARAIMGMVPIEEGNVVWLGTDVTDLDQKSRRPHRKTMQMIFQDPLASLNPRMTIGDIIAEPLKIHSPGLSDTQRRAKVRTMMEKVGLHANQVSRYPHEFSGGQCQRIGIARALITDPKLVICDEPVSALDVSIQAQVVNLLMDLQKEMGLSLIFIAHDLSVVRHISDRIMVLYLGTLMEEADSDTLYECPAHPYTQALISAVPIPDPEIEKDKPVMLLEGDIPSPLNPPSGCVFRTRCPKAQALCASDKPTLDQFGESHSVACHYIEIQKKF